MFAAFMKYLPIILKLQDISVVLREEHPGDHGLLLSKRLWSVIAATVFTILGYFAIDTNALGFTSDQLANAIINVVSAGISLVGMIWSIAAQIKGWYDKGKRVGISESNKRTYDPLAKKMILR